jgi:hypothetical protein
MLLAMTKSPVTTRPSDAAPQRSRRMRPVAELVGAAGGAAFRRFGFVQSSIVSRWGEIVGERYAAVSTPEVIRFPHGKKANGVLTLLVEGAHASTMQHVAPAIIERVNRFFGYEAVARISFRQGRLPAARRTRRADSDQCAVPPELGDSLREVTDPELRACLESLARGLASGADMPVVTTIPLVGKIGDAKK